MRAGWKGQKTGIPSNILSRRGRDFPVTWDENYLAHLTLHEAL